MSAQWNISVRLTGQGSGLSRTLKELSRDARAASRDVNALNRDIRRLRDEARRDIRLKVTVDGRHLRRQVRDAVREAGAGNRIEVPLHVNARGLRAEVRRALTGASGRGVDVRLRVDRARLRSEVRAAIRAATAGQRIRIPISLQNPAALRRDVDRAVRAASRGQRIRIPVTGDNDTRNAPTPTPTPTPTPAASSSSSSSAFSMKEALLLAQALGPIVGLTAQVTAGFAAGATGAAAFGVAILGQVSAISKATEAETAYKDAVAEHGVGSQEAAQAQVVYQKQLEKLPPATRRAAAEFSTLKDEYQGWSDSLSGVTMEPVIHGMQLTRAIMPSLTPMVTGAAGAFDRLVTVAAGAFATPGFDRLMDKLSNASTGALNRLVTDIIRLADADSSFGGGALQDFMAYARANGPLAAEALHNLVDALVHILAATGDAGVSLLKVVNGLAGIVNAVPQGALTAIIGLATALKLVSMASRGLGALGPAAAGLRGTVTSMTRLQKVGAGLGVLGVAALALDHFAAKARGVPPDVDRLTTSLKQLGETGEFTGELKSTFGDMDGLVARYQKLQQVSKETAKAQEGVFGFRIPGLDDAADWLAGKTDDLTKGKDSLRAMRDEFDSVDKALAKLAASGNAKDAAAGFDLVKAALRKGGASPKEIAATFNDYKKALADVKVEQELAARGMGVFGQQAIATSAKLEAQKASADGLRQSIQALNDAQRTGLGGMIGFEAAIDAASKAAKENAGALSMSHGELNLNSAQAQAAATALNDLAAKTDEAAASARQSGSSWETVNGIYERGRAQLVSSAQQMGLTAAQANVLADRILQIPDKKSLSVEMRTEDAVSGLNSVIEQIKKTPDKKSVTVDALTGDAVSVIESLGYTVKELPDGRFQVTADTGSAKTNLADLKGIRDALKDKTLTVGANVNAAMDGLTIVQGKIRATPGAKSITVKTLNGAAIAALNAVGIKTKQLPDGRTRVYTANGQALGAIGQVRNALAALDGKTASTYTNHYVRTQYVNMGKKQPGPYAGKYKFNADGGTVDYYADGGLRDSRDRPNQHVAEIAPAGSYRVFAERETGGESYIPLHPSKRPRSRAIAEETVRRLGGDPASIAWYADGGMDFSYSNTSTNKYTLSGLVSASNDKKGNFSLSIFTSKLRASNNALDAWRSNLRKVAQRAGQDVADALEEMGDEGIALTKKMATGSSKYVKDMAAQLRNLAGAAKASLGEYTSQLNAAVKDQTTFQKNLATLAAQGYGALAARLASDNNEDAEALAASAVKSKSAAASANRAAAAADKALSGEQLGQLVQIIAAITSSKTGIHDVAATTGLGEDDIIATANKASAQIKSSLGSRSTKFLADLARANKHMSYADGGIRSGIYATKGGAVTFAEPSTGGEAYIPLGRNKRPSATAVLGDVAGRFGLGLTSAQAARPVVIVKSGDTITIPVTPVRTGASASDIGAQVGRSYRRARRGGVAARGA